VAPARLFKAAFQSGPLREGSTEVATALVASLSILRPAKSRAKAYSIYFAEKFRATANESEGAPSHQQFSELSLQG
jgi:hypothetical protein